VIPTRSRIDTDHTVPFDPTRAPERQGQRRHLYTTGTVVGLPPEILQAVFDATKPHTFCNICGAIYQSKLDRSAMTPAEAIQATEQRKSWSHLHSQSHSHREHELFKQSGRFVTPEAAHRLVPYGIIPLSDQMFDEEVDHAARTAPRMPDLAIVEFHSNSSKELPTCRFTS